MKLGPSSSSSIAAAVAAAEQEAELDDHRGDRGEEARQRHDHHVAVDDVGDLVGHDALELGRGEQLHDPGGRADGRRPSCERPSAKALGSAVCDDRDLRLGDVGLDAQALDHRVQLGRLLRRDLAGAHGAQRELVGGEELERGAGRRR